VCSSDLQGVVLVNPQFSGTISPMLANALNWISAIDGKLFSRLAFGLVACAPGASGGSESLSHMRDMLVSTGGNVITPQLGVCTDEKLFDVDERLINSQYQAGMRDLSSHLMEQASLFSRG